MGCPVALSRDSPPAKVGPRWGDAGATHCPAALRAEQPHPHPAPHQGWTPPAPAACFLFLPVGICTEFHILPQTRARRRGGGEEGLRTKRSAWRSPFVCIYGDIYILVGNPLPRTVLLRWDAGSARGGGTSHGRRRCSALSH